MIFANSVHNWCRYKFICPYFGNNYLTSNLLSRLLSYQECLFYVLLSFMLKKNYFGYYYTGDYDYYQSPQNQKSNNTKITFCQVDRIQKLEASWSLPSIFRSLMQHDVLIWISRVENLNVCTCPLLWLIYKVYWHHTFLIMGPPTQQNLRRKWCSHSFCAALREFL